MSLFSRLSFLFPSGLRGDDGRYAKAKGEVEQARSVQRVLSREIEGVFRDYDQELRALGLELQRIGGLEDETQLAHTLDDIRERQEALWQILFRFQATRKTSQTLWRELAEWEEREDGELRAEMVRSELASREVAARYASQEAPVEELREAKGSFPLPASTVPVSVETSTPAIRDQDVISAIREATREAERWHALSHSHHDHEAIVQVRHVKELHAALKVLDRERGIRRERLPFFIRVRDAV